MTIRFGKKYTCGVWEGRYYTIPHKMHIDNVRVTGTTYHIVEDVSHTSHYLKTYFYDNSRSDSLNFYLVTKKIKNTALARKMYPEGEEEGEWLVIYG